MRRLLILLLLAAPALAAPGPGSWRIVRCGADPSIQTSSANTSGNACQLDILVGPLLTDVFGLAITDLLSADQEGVGQGEDEAWFTLVFCGDSAGSTEHRWEIVTKIHGSGFADAGVDLVGNAWAESLHLVEFTGDNEHKRTGQIAVDECGGTEVALGFPSGFRISSGRGTRSKEIDEFQVSSIVTTRGPGKLCRVHSHTYAKAHVSADCLTLFGAATAFVKSSLCGDLTMKGYCRIGTTLVIDTFAAAIDKEDFEKHTVDAPSGGIESDPDDPPPDDPTDEEREGQTDEEEPVDADDLPGGTETPDENPPAPEEAPSGGLGESITDGVVTGALEAADEAQTEQESEESETNEGG